MSNGQAAGRKNSGNAAVLDQTTRMLAMAHRCQAHDSTIGESRRFTPGPDKLIGATTMLPGSGDDAAK